MNKYGAWLLRGGIAAVVVGGLIGLVARNLAERDAFAHELYLSMGGFGSDGSAAPGFMWFGIVVAVLGALAVIAYLAARSSSVREDSPS